MVSDIHHGRDTKTKRGSAALAHLRRFVEDAATGGAHAVVELGDRISDETPERDVRLQEEVGREFAGLRIPHHHLNGNHDLAALEPKTIEAALGVSTSSKAIDCGEVRLVLWNADVRLPRERGLQLAPGDLDELRMLLGADNRRTFVFSHVPLSGHSQLGNYYFEGCPDRSTYLADLPAIRETLRDAPCPVVCFAGHVHWNSLTVVDGIAHLTLQSLTETCTTGEPAGCTGLIELDGNRLRWLVGGIDRFSVELEWPKQKRRWLRR